MDILENKQLWSEMCGKATNEILNILEGLPVVVAEQALKNACHAISSISVVGHNEVNYTEFPFGDINDFAP